MINNGSIETVINYSKGPSLGIVDVDIAYEENIVVTEEEVEIELKRIQEYYKLNDEQIKEFKSKNLGEFENKIVKQKVFKFVVENL